MKRHIVILQYAGEYADAYERIGSGGGETYASQEYSLRVVEQLVGIDSQVSSICCISESFRDKVLPNGVHSIAMGFVSKVDEDAVWRAISEMQPTHLLLRAPFARILKFAKEQKLPVVVTLADSFVAGGMAARFKHARLARLLNSPNVLVVGNHGRAACQNLEHIGVDRRKIVPWDWPQPPVESRAKLYPQGRPLKLLYAGAIEAAKGVGDLIRAAARLNSLGHSVSLEILGSGNIDEFSIMARKLDMQGVVNFAGRVRNTEVSKRMRETDVVVVPSRHEYPEGLPLTIYEALRSRTPLVASDHPMFSHVLSEGKSAKIFKAGDPRSLADAILSLQQSPSLYELLSANGEEAWNSIQIQTKWGDLVHGWLPPITSSGTDTNH